MQLPRVLLFFGVSLFCLSLLEIRANELISKEVKVLFSTYN